MTGVELTSADGVVAPVPPGTRHGHARAAVVARRTVTAAVAILVVTSIWGHHQQLEAGFHLLKHLSWWWLPVAAVAQGTSMASFALLQRRLLRAGDLEISAFDMAKISLAANAISGSLPGGAAWSAPWSWRQLRQRGADRRLATWVVLASGVLSSLALFVIVIAGTELAGSHGPVASLRWLDRVLAALAVTTGVLVTATWPRRKRRPTTGRLDALYHRMGVVHLGVAGWGMSVLLAMANWLLDLVCLAACIVAVGSGIEWRGVVVVYSLTQLIAVLPFTPGGLGVVEAGLSALLISYGMPAAPAIATVVLYRALTFWMLVPGGWVVWWRLDRRLEPTVLASEAREPRAVGRTGWPWATPLLEAAAPRAPITFGQARVLVAGAGTTGQAPSGV